MVKYNDVPYDFMMLFLRHLYSDSLKVESKYIYELLSVSQISCNPYCSWRTASRSRHSRRNVNRFWRSTSPLTLCVKSLSTQTSSTVNDCRKRVYSSLRSRTTKYSRQRVSRTWTRKRSSRSSALVTTPRSGNDLRRGPNLSELTLTSNHF